MTGAAAIAGMGLAGSAGIRPAGLVAAVRDRRWSAAAPPPAPADLPFGELGRVRLARYLTAEARLFLYAGVMAARQSGLERTGAGDALGVVCATRSGGLAEYVQMYRSGRSGIGTGANPVRGPQSSFNAPASHLSLHLGARAACLTLAGGPSTGLAALRHGQVLIGAGRAAGVLVGAVDRAGSGAGAEAAVALALVGDAPDPPLARLAPVVGGAGGATDIVGEALAAAGIGAGEVDAVVASGPGSAASLPPGRYPAPLVVEAGVGEVGAAAGALTVLCATHLVGEPVSPPRHVLCVSCDPPGSYAAAVVSHPSAGGP